LQAQHRCADCARLRDHGRAWIRFRCEPSRDDAHRAGHGLDLAFHRLLCRRVGTPHERGRNGPLTPVWDDPMIYSRQLTFWLVTFLVLAAALWLLHRILLPFMTIIAIAPELTPRADHREPVRVKRAFTSLLG